jgi:hypothetical protein
MSTELNESPEQEPRRSGRGGQRRVPLLAAVMVGGVLGFLLAGMVGALVAAIVSGERNPAVTTDGLLYGDQRTATKMEEVSLSHARLFCEAIGSMVTRVPTRQPIDAQRKVSLLNALHEQQVIEELMLSLALGAAQDESSEVRWACANILKSWQGVLHGSVRSVITRSIAREVDPDVKDQMRAFLNSEAPPEVESSSPLPTHE